MLLSITAGCLVVASLLLIVQIIENAQLKRSIRLREPVYVDTSGIDSNPPKFIELMKNKTINFVLDGEKIVIPQINVIRGLNEIERIAQCFKMLYIETHKEDVMEISDWKHSIKKLKIYRQIITQIYNLSKPFVKNKSKFKRALVKKCNSDFEWTLLLVEQILDYWGYVGESLRLLARGGTLRQIHGGQLIWSCINWDISGKMRIGPRYVSSGS